MSLLSPVTDGACPICEGIGRVGDPCGERVCRRQGVSYIPRQYARAAWEASNHQSEPMVGHFIGDFLILERIGQGGFGRVLLALQRPLFRMKAAVKLLEIGDRDAVTAARIRKKFENEAAILAVLHHPNIVQLLRYGLNAGRPYLAMEFVPGGQTLQTLMQRLIIEGSQIEPSLIKHILNQVLDGLEAAHRMDVIHRDIKPENIMLTEVVGNDRHVKLLDFGIAKVVEDRRDTTAVMGTVQYMAPEQIEGRNIGPWTDLYATGCIAYEFITGQRAFRAENPQAILHQKMLGEFDPTEELGNRLPPGPVLAFLRKALARKPEDRFQTTSEFRAAMNELYHQVANTNLFARDLTGMVDPSELERLRDEQRRLELERQNLELERREIDRERRELAVERERISSQLGQAEEVESVAHGPTVMLPGRVADPALGLKELDTSIKDRGTTGVTSAKSRRSRVALIVLSLVAIVGVGVAVILAVAARGDLEAPADVRVVATEPPAPLPKAVSAAPEEPAAEQVRPDDEETPADAAAASALEVRDVAPEDAAVAAAGPEVVEEAEVVEAAGSPPATPVASQIAFEITSEPRAAVYVDREPIGTTPRTVTWRSDEPLPRIRLIARGYYMRAVEPSGEELDAGGAHYQLRKKEPTDPGIEIPTW